MMITQFDLGSETADLVPKATVGTISQTSSETFKSVDKTLNNASLLWVLFIFFIALLTKKYSKLIKKNY